MSQHEAASLGRGEAYQQCVRELQQPEPDYERAQVLATLSLHEAMRDAADELGAFSGGIDALSGIVRDGLAALNETIDLASRRR